MAHGSRERDEEAVATTNRVLTLGAPRAAGPGELDALRTLDVACFVRPWTSAHWQAEIASPRASVEVVADPSGALVFSRVCMWVLDEGSLLRIATRPDWRGHGLARAGMARVEDEARRRGVRTIDLEVAARNGPARELYAACGYVEVGRRGRYYDDGDDAILLRRTL